MSSEKSSDAPLQTPALSTSRARRPAKKAQIRAVAARLFAEKGYHATGIEELSQAVGLGRGALYHHIGSKEELLYEISSAGMNELLDAGTKALAKQASSVDKLHLMSRTLMRIIADNQFEMTVLFREIDLMSPPYRDALIRRRTEYQDQWSQIIAEGIAGGEIRPVDRAIVMAVLGMHNYSHLWMRNDGRLQPEELGDLFMSSMLNGLSLVGDPVAVPDDAHQSTNRAESL